MRYERVPTKTHAGYAVKLAVLQEDIEAGGTATVKLKERTEAGTWITTEVEEEIEAPPYFIYAGTIEAPAEVKIERIDGVWLLAAAPCPTEEEE